MLLRMPIAGAPDQRFGQTPACCVQDTTEDADVDLSLLETLLSVLSDSFVEALDATDQTGVINIERISIRSTLHPVSCVNPSSLREPLLVAKVDKVARACEASLSAGRCDRFLIS